MRRALAVVGAALAILSLAAAAADEPAGDLVTDGVASRLQVSLVTVEPGPYYWQRYGHNAILVEDPATDFAGLYNYGVFDFDRPGFVTDFLLGRMQYRLLALDANRDARRYLEDGRPIIVQRLNLDAPQKLRLIRFLEWNRRPENAEYQYDYFFDNCSTRVRDALDLALGGQLRSALESRAAGRTLRQHAVRYSAPDWWVLGGVIVGLGRPVDEPIDVWIEAFIPMVLRDAVAELEVVTQDGPIALVADRRALQPENPVAVPGDSPRVWPYWLVAGLIVAAAVWIAGGSRTRLARWFNGVLAFELGVIGLLLALLWVLTDHQGAYRNENILLFSPVFLLLGVVILRRAGSGIRRGLLSLLAVSTVVALAMKFLPFSQSNAEVMSFMLPVNLAYVLALWSRRALTPAYRRAGAA